MCDILREIYRNVFDEEYNYEKIDNRIKLQKTIYLMDKMGISVGDYSFRLHEHGPYSLKLDIDSKEKFDSGDINFSASTQKAFAQVREIVNQAQTYPLENWLECVTTLHYLKEEWHLKPNKIFDKLVEIKDHLIDSDANKKAYNCLKLIQLC